MDTNYYLLKNANSVEIYCDNELVYKTNIEDKKVVFDYDIPDNSFRVAYWTKRVKFKCISSNEHFQKNICCHHMTK